MVKLGTISTKRLILTTKAMSSKADKSDEAKIVLNIEQFKLKIALKILKSLLTVQALC